MHGEGTYVYASSNDIYSGSWSDGKRHGQGVYEFSKDKSVLKGYWNKLGDIEEGEWIMTHDIIYSGKFHHGKPMGKGKFTIGPTSSSVSGSYVEKIPSSNNDVEQGSSIRWISVDALKM